MVCTYIINMDIMYLKFKSCNKQITQFLNYYKIEIQNSTKMFLEKTNCQQRPALL